MPPKKKKKEPHKGNEFLMADMFDLLAWLDPFAFYDS
jgi:hypothetical protein